MSHQRRRYDSSIDSIEDEVYEDFFPPNRSIFLDDRKNSIYSGMPHPSEMHYLPQNETNTTNNDNTNNMQFTTGSHYNSYNPFNNNESSTVDKMKIQLAQSFDTIKELEDSLASKDNEILESNNNLNKFKSLYNELQENYLALVTEDSKDRSAINNEQQQQQLQQLENKIISQEQIIEKLQRSLELKENEILESNNDLNQIRLNYEKEYQSKVKNLKNGMEKVLREAQQTIDDNKNDQKRFKLQEQKIDKLQKSLELKEIQLQNLEKELVIKKNNNSLNQVSLLQDEAQFALEIVSNFSLNQDDQNNNVKFNKDILALHDILENYVTNLKSKIDVNVNEAKRLLLKYGCKTEITDNNPNKPFIKAVLQRHVLEEILDQANFYFTRSSSKEHDLESNIVKETKSLTDLMEKLYNNRFGDDEISRLTPIRLRQQVYASLGTRGFNDIKNFESENSEHNVVSIISKRINDTMNNCRVIKSTEKKNQVNALAETLVRNVLKIFYFRLLIQEPIAQYHWCSNDEKINKSYMKGSWDDDEIENLAVEVCSFPLIFKPSQSGGFKIFTPAKVFPRRIESTEKLVNVVDKLCGVPKNE